jgi:ferrous iron transport protein B
MLGCPVVETVSSSAKGVKDVVKAALSVTNSKQIAPYSQADIDFSDKSAVESEDKRRYAFVNGIVGKVETRKVLTKNKNFQDEIDAVLTNKWVGIPIFALVMLAVFWISQAGPAVWLADGLVGLLEMGQGAISDVIPGDSIWKSILIDGVIGGVIAVIGFLPLVMVMYFLIALLEDCGYMARAAVVLDPIFKKVGLSGKSVIPFIIGTGCAIPGVMACRTIRGERERRATAMLAPFMPCGAKLPVIALFAGVFFGDSAWVGALMYFVGIIIIFIGALLVNLITCYKVRKSYFIMELPEYKAPSIPKAFFSMCERGWSYIVKAGTIILVCNFVIHVMQNFGWSFKVVENASDSILATVATPFAYLFAPVVGYVSWQLAAAAITGFIAKENVVGTLAVCFGITNLINVDELALEGGASVSEVALAFGTGSGGPMIAASALAFLMFNLFTPPCFAAIGAMNSELKSKKWLFAGIGLQFSVGYTVGFLVNFFGTLFTGAKFAQGWTYILGWVVVAAIVAIYTFIIIRNRKKMKAEYELKKSQKAAKQTLSA